MAGPPPALDPGAPGEGEMGESTQHRSPRRCGALGDGRGHGGQAGTAVGDEGGLPVGHEALPRCPGRVRRALSDLRSEGKKEGREGVWPLL